MRRSLALAVLLLVGCGADEPGGATETDAGNTDAGNDAAGFACSEPQQCPSFECECVDGSGTNVYATCEGGVCGDSGAPGCETACAEAGGVARVADQPNPHVAGSQECLDFCAYYEAQSAELPCFQGPCPLSACEIVDGTTAEETRAFLACAAAGGAHFSCLDGETLEVSYDC